MRKFLKSCGYIAGKEDRAELEEIDTLLSVALEEVRRKLAGTSRSGKNGEKK